MPASVTLISFHVSGPYTSPSYPLLIGVGLFFIMYCTKMEVVLTTAPDADEKNPNRKYDGNCCPAHLIRLVSENVSPANGLSASIPSVVHLKKAETAIGRGRNAVDVHLDSASVPRMISRVHAYILFCHNQWKVRDNRSVNGVFVNDKKVHEALLKDDDIVVFGQACNRIGVGIIPNDFPEFKYIFKLSPFFQSSTPSLAEMGEESEEDTVDDQADTKKRSREEAFEDANSELGTPFHEEDIIPEGPPLKKMIFESQDSDENGENPILTQCQMQPISDNPDFTTANRSFMQVDSQLSNSIMTKNPNSNVKHHPQDNSKLQLPPFALHSFHPRNWHGTLPPFKSVANQDTMDENVPTIPSSSPSSTMDRQFVPPVSLEERARRGGNVIEQFDQRSRQNNQDSPIPFGAIPLHLWGNERLPEEDNPASSNNNASSSGSMEKAGSPNSDDIMIIDEANDYATQPIQSRSDDEVMFVDVPTPSVPVVAPTFDDFIAPFSKEQQSSLKELWRRLLVACEERDIMHPVHQWPDDSPMQCKRCRNFMWDPIHLKCGHLYCDGCVERIVISSIAVRSGCPACGTLDILPCSHNTTLRDDIRTQIGSWPEKTRVEARQLDFQRNEKMRTAKLQLMLNFEKEKGSVACSIGDVWSDKQRREFAENVERQYGHARIMFCAATGLTIDWIEKATQSQLITALCNVRLSLTPIISRSNNNSGSIISFYMNKVPILDGVRPPHLVEEQLRNALKTLLYTWHFSISPRV